jgi:hypothetical protein
MLSYCLADDLNSDLGRSCSQLAKNPSRTSRNRAVEACCTAEGTATGRFGGPPINKEARGGVDPIPLSSSSRHCRFLFRRCPAILRPSCSHARTRPASISGQPRASAAAPCCAPLAHARQDLSVRKVVPTLTSKSAEIYLSMAGAKQLVTRGLSWFRPGPYVQQWCARGTILRCTVVLAEGGYKRGGRGGRASRSQRFFD